MLISKIGLIKNIRIAAIITVLLITSLIGTFVSTDKVSALPSPAEPTFVGGADASGI